LLRSEIFDQIKVGSSGKVLVKHFINISDFYEKCQKVQITIKKTY